MLFGRCAENCAARTTQKRVARTIQIRVVRLCRGKCENHIRMQETQRRRFEFGYGGVLQMQQNQKLICNLTRVRRITNVSYGICN